MMDLANLSTLDDQPDPSAGLLPNQVVVNCCSEEKRGNWSILCIPIAIRKHDHVRTICDGFRDFAADLLDSRHQSRSTAGNREESTDYVR